MLVALVLIWLYVDSLPARVALSLVAMVSTPVLVVLTLDRRI